MQTILGTLSVSGARFIHALGSNSELVGDDLIFAWRFLFLLAVVESQHND
jgi:hypothetical protein